MVGYAFGWGQIPRHVPRAGFNRIPFFYHFNLMEDAECEAIRALAPQHIANGVIHNANPNHIHMIVMNQHSFGLLIYVFKFMGTCLIVYLIYRVCRFSFFQFKRDFQIASAKKWNVVMSN